jgi:hypothetical protein
MPLNFGRNAAVCYSPERILEMNKELVLRLWYYFVEHAWHLCHVFVISVSSFRDIFAGCPWCLCRVSVTSLSGFRNICAECPWHICRVSVIYMGRVSVTYLSSVRNICVECPWHICRVSEISAPSVRDIFVECPWYVCGASVTCVSNVRIIFVCWRGFLEQLHNTVYTFFLIFQIFIFVLSCNVFLQFYCNIFIVFIFRDSASCDRYEKLIYAVSVSLLYYLVNARHSYIRKYKQCYTEDCLEKPKTYENMEEDITISDGCGFLEAM